MKYVLANDPHLSLKAPVSRIDDYHTVMFGKLYQLLNLSIAIKAEAILLAGDIFNQKTGVPIRLVFEVWEWCIKVQQAGKRVIAIPGNHDLENDRYDSLSRQPLGLLFLGGAMEDASYRVIPVGDVDVVGIPYPAAKNRNMYDSLPPPVQSRAILMSHCFATPEGGEYFGEPVIPYSDLLSLPYNVFHFGHDHSDHGVHKIDGKWFINLGSLSRGALSHDNVSRDVKCAIVDAKADGEIEVKQVKLSYRPASEVFDLALKAQKERESTHIEAFVEDIKEGLMDVGPIDFKEKLVSIEMPDKVRKKVINYIETAEESAA